MELKDMIIITDGEDEVTVNPYNGIERATRSSHADRPGW